MICRKKEIEDPEDVLNDKCSKLAAAIAKAKNLVVYTGAGISTAAGIKFTFLSTNQFIDVKEKTSCFDLSSLFLL